MAKSFFEMSFQEWARATLKLDVSNEDMTARRLKVATVEARLAWHLKARAEWLAIKGGSHYHGGEGCVRVPTCERYEQPADATAE